MPKDFSWKTIPTEEYQLLVQALEALEPLAAAATRALTALDQRVVTLEDLKIAQTALRRGLSLLEAKLPDPPPPEDELRLRVVR